MKFLLGVLWAAIVAHVTASGPFHHFISHAGEYDMAVTWATETQQSCKAVFGLSSGQYTGSETSTPSTYTFWGFESVWLHQVVLSGLKPSTTYYYQVQCPDGNGAEASFTTSPPIGTLPFTWGVIGDLGQTNYSSGTVDAVVSNQNIQSTMIVGDMSYADSDMGRWESWFTLIEKLASRTPMMVAVGNHEIESAPEGKFLAYASRFRMPWQESAGGAGNSFYSYKIGGLHVIVLNTYVAYDSTSDQYKWLATELGKVDRLLTPWLIVIMHAPWYNSNKSHQKEAENMRLAMEDLLHQSSVDVVMDGHVHSYERTHRVYNNALDSTGAVYINIGDGGNREGLYATWITPKPVWSDFRQADYGHGVFTAYNATHARWSWRRESDFIAPTSDDVWIVKGAQPFSAKH